MSKDSERDIKNKEKEEKNDKQQFKVVDKRRFSEDENVGESDVKPEGESAPKQDSKPVDVADKETGKESENSSEAPTFGADFATFIYSLNTQALLFLGKVPNPSTGKYEKDVKMAKYLIDTIEMLSKKTKGNLDENETKLVENVLYDIRMAYISEKK
ncbi:DUF1844 domain-containing protein [Candidatus Acidulodesulfobacterium sp. H_13]|uniref:DUF1844 domain-containing protein n=1 Tax=Candidatus Acidulodesulfobacterium sp. H_13 TaxID=3395470 RepID=UPI003AF5EBC3